VKNDSVDARTLAHLLRTNLLPEAWIAGLSARSTIDSPGEGALGKCHGLSLSAVQSD